MYSMVMMMAMTASPEAVACHKPAGCLGSCQGVVVTSCHGCIGSSCHGYSSCHGCIGSSCLGSCHGRGLFGGHGCSGGLFGKRSHGCHGCTGYSCSGCIGTPVVPAEPKKEMPKKTAAPANITVNVPADAKISIDGAPTKSTSTVRVFATPELANGTVYYYTITAEVVRDGKTLVATEKVAVEAGANVNISLSPDTASSVVSK